MAEAPKFVVLLERKPRSGKQTVYLAKRVDKPLTEGSEIIDPHDVLFETYAVYKCVGDAMNRAMELNRYYEAKKVT